MDEESGPGEDNLSLSTKDEENEEKAESRGNEREEFKPKVDAEGSRSEDEDKREVNLESGSDNPAFTGDIDDDISPKLDGDINVQDNAVLEDVELEDKGTQNVEKGDPSYKYADEDYFSIDSNSNRDIAGVQGSGGELKRWEGKMELNELEANGKKRQQKETISNGKPRETKTSRPSPFKSAFFISKYITFWWVEVYLFDSRHHAL